MQQEPKVMKMYAKHITGIFDMPRSAQKVLGYVLDKMNDDNEIVIAAGGKTQMLEAVGMKTQTLNNSLCELSRSGILANTSKGVYVANPEIFSLKKKWGDVMNQQRKFRAIIDYTPGSSFKIKGAWND